MRSKEVMLVGGPHDGAVFPYSGETIIKAYTKPIKILGLFNYYRAETVIYNVQIIYLDSNEKRYLGIPEGELLVTAIDRIFDSYIKNAPRNGGKGR